MSANATPLEAVISVTQRQRRQDASEFAKASVSLEGFPRAQEAQAHADRFIKGEIDLKGYLAPTFEELHCR